MTTSPFGSPSPFGGTATLERDTAPEPQTTSAPPEQENASRGKLLYVLLAVVVLAAAAVGAYFLFFTGSQEPQAAVVTPPAAAPVEDVEPVEPETPVSQFDELAGRNPFAALVTEGGEAAAPTSPVVAAPTSVSPTGSTSGTTSGTSGSTAGAAGADGQNGVDGKDGVNGADGRDGADGRTPTWVTITLRDVDEVAGTGTFTVRDAAGENNLSGVAVDDALAEIGVEAVHPVVVRSFEDVDGDLAMDYAIVQVGDGATYSVWIGEALPIFAY